MRKNQMNGYFTQIPYIGPDSNVEGNDSDSLEPVVGVNISQVACTTLYEVAYCFLEPLCKRIKHACHGAGIGSPFIGCKELLLGQKFLKVLQILGVGTSIAESRSYRLSSKFIPSNGWTR